MKARALAPGKLGEMVRSQSDSLWILAERVVTNLLNFVVILAIMRLLGPAAYGQWAFAISITGVLLVTGHLGLDGLLVRKLVEDPARARVLLGVTATLKYAIYLPAIAAVLVFFEFAAVLGSEERALLHVLMIAVLAAPLTSSLVAWANAQSQFAPAARGRIAAVAAGFAAKIGLIAAGFGVVAVGAAHSAMFAVEAAILLLVVKQRGGPLPWQWRFDSATAGALLSQSMFLFAATIFATLYLSLDVIVMRAYRSAYDVGLYALVPQVILASQLVPYAVTVARFPALTRAASVAEDRAAYFRAIWKSLRDLVALSALAAGGLALFILFAFDLVFGPNYAATKPVLWLACAVLPPIFVRQLTTKIFILSNQGGQLALIEFAGLLMVTAVLLIGVPLYGGFAAVTAVASGCWLTVIASLLMFDGGRFVRGSLNWLKEDRQGK